MTTKKLMKLLEHVGRVSTSNWSVFMKLAETIKTNPKVKIVSKEWNDRYKNNSEYYPLDLGEIKTWSSFDDKRILEFIAHENKLICEGRVYTSGYFDRRHTLEFKAELILPNSFISNIEAEIGWKFNNEMEYQYEKYLESEKRKWIEYNKNLILESL